MFGILFYGLRHLAVLYAVTYRGFADIYFLCLNGKTFTILKEGGAFSTGILLNEAATFP